MTYQERMDLTRCKNDVQRGHITNIEEYGVSLLMVMEDDKGPGWAYTIGFWHQYSHPEVLIVGLREGLTKILLNNLNAFIRDEGRRFEDGAEPTNVLDGYTCHFKNISPENYGDWFAADNWFYGGSEFEAVQMIWPNVSGVYPWENAADEYLRYIQPIISTLPTQALQ